jgi:hypothetical protein
MTPHIITDHIQSRTVTDEFKEKAEGIKKELERKEKKEKEYLTQLNKLYKQNTPT